MQLEAQRRGRSKPPRRMCDRCVAEIQQYEPREVACKHEGCERSWTWSPESQLVAALGGRSGGAPRRMCDECAEFLKNAKPIELECEGCKVAITWTREHQLNVALGVWVKPTLCADCRRASATSSSGV
jgi:hypothetical protein